MKILLVNPAKSSQVSLEGYLHYPEYSITTLQGKTGFDKNIRITHPDLVILFERKDNTPILIKIIEFIRSKKGFNNTHIIFIGEQLNDEKMIELYDSGVDFIFLNTVSLFVISKYIQNIKSKYTPLKTDNNSFISLNSNNYSVTIRDKITFLVKREFELLQMLITPPNKIYTRNEIIQHIWSDMQLKNDRTIDVHITRIRQKLNIDNIITVKRKGYKFVI